MVHACLRKGSKGGKKKRKIGKLTNIKGHLSSNTHNFLLRTISAILGGSTLIACILIGEYTYLFAFSVVILGTLWEFYNSFKKKGYKPLRIWGIVFGLATFVSTFFMIKYNDLFIGLWLVPIGFFSLLYMLYVKIARSKNISFIDISITFLGILYVGSGLSMVHLIAFNNQNIGGIKVYRHDLLMSVMAMIWSYDTFSYLIGSWIGRRPFLRNISPRKTWEGFMGGMLGACITGIVVSLYNPHLHIRQCIVLAILVSITCALGDGAASMLKRELKVKDSGRLIPGHGGFLDRFDGVILTFSFSPILLLILRLISG